MRCRMTDAPTLVNGTTNEYEWPINFDAPWLCSTDSDCERMLGNGVAHKWTMNMSDKGDNIYFKGKYDFTNLMAELADCDILLHTSRHESFGMVLVEAMAMGIPVVAGQNSGGVCEILSEGGGVLVEVKDPLKVAAGLEFLLIGENYAIESIVARKVATERYREDSVVNLYLNIYRRIIEEA